MDTRNHAETYTLGATNQLSSRFTNEFVLATIGLTPTIVGTADGFGGGTPINLAAAMGAGAIPSAYSIMYFSILGIGTQDFATPNSGNLARQWNLVDTFSTSLGRHQVKVGVDYRRIKSPLRLATTEMFTYFLSPQSILSNSPDIPEILRYNQSTPIFNETAASLRMSGEFHARLESQRVFDGK